MDDNSTKKSSPEDPLRTFPAQAGLGVTGIPQLREAVRARRGGYDALLRERGHLSAYDFVKDYVTRSMETHATPERKKQLIGAIQELVTERLDAATAKSVGQQLEKYYCASTTDHFGPLHHPWVLHYSLLSSLVMDEHPDPLLKHQISLAYASVSFNNCFFPRGVTYTSPTTPAKPQRIPLFPNSVSSRCVYNFRGFGESDLQNALRLTENCGDSFMQDRMSQFIRNVFGKVTTGVTRFTAQITKGNFALWRAVRSAMGLRKNGELIYLDIEWLVSKMLTQHHLTDPQSRLYKVLFDPLYAEKFQRLFADLPETYSLQEKRGTYLFWYLTPEDRRVSLWPEGNELVSVDGTVRIPCTPEVLCEKLLQRELMPSTLTTFLVTCFEHGLACLGALGQIGYLPLMQKAWMQLLRETDEAEVAERVAMLPTNEMGGDLILLFLEHRDASLYPATVMDVLLYADGMTGQLLREQAKSLSIADALDATLPEDYAIMYKVAERDPMMMALSVPEVTKLLQESGKLQAALSVPTLNQAAIRSRPKTVQSRLRRVSSDLRVMFTQKRLPLVG